MEEIEKHSVTEGKHRIVAYTRVLAESRAFYESMEAYERLNPKTCRVLYLYSEDIAAALHQIRRERVDDRGQEIWYEMVMQYFRESPYGRPMIWIQW